MKRILLVALSVIAFTACSKKDNDDSTNYPKELQGTWEYEDSTLPDGKLFSVLIPSQEMQCYKQTKYTFNSDVFSAEEHRFEQGNCSENTTRLKYFVENNQLCFKMPNGATLRAYNIISLSPTRFIFKYTDDFKSTLRSNFPYDPSLQKEGYSFNDILNVTISYKKQ